MKKWMSAVLTGMGLAFLLGGCATYHSPLMVPVRPAPHHNLEQPAVAHLRIPVVVKLPSLAEVEKRLSDFVKQDMQKSEKSLVKSLGATLWWDPMTWDFNGNSLTAHFQAHTVDAKDLEAQKAAQKSMADVQKDLHLDLSSPISWDKNMRLTAPGFQEEAEPDAGVTEEQEDKARRLLKKGTTQFHESLQQKTNELTKKAKEFWLRIQEPFRMAEDIWLQIRPNAMSVGAMQLVPDAKEPRLETVFDIEVQPNLAIGEKPRFEIVEMPPLKDYKKGPPGFHIEMPLKISFKEVNKILVDPKIGILNKAIPGGGDHKLKIDHLYIYGSGGQLVVEAGIEYQPIMNLSNEPAKLMVYLLGTPVYHEDQQTIDFPDMDFDIQTSDFLVQMAEAFEGSSIRDHLREKAVVPVGKQLDNLKVKMTELLNRPIGSHARLHTTVTGLKLKEAYVSDDGLEARVAMDGDASVDVDW